MCEELSDIRKQWKMRYNLLDLFDNLVKIIKSITLQLIIEESGIKIVPANTVIMSSKLTIGRTAITSEDIYTNEAIVAFNKKASTLIMNDYLRLYLSLYDWTEEQMNAVKGVTLNSTSIGNVLVSIPPIELQKLFADYTETCDKLKFEVDKFRHMKNFTYYFGT